MKKYVVSEVTDCERCPSFQFMIDDYYCTNQNPAKRIDFMPETRFPVWCPLPDKVETFCVEKSESKKCH